MNDTIFLIINNKEFSCRKSYMMKISPTIKSFYDFHPNEDCFSCEVEFFEENEKIFQHFINNEEINITFDSISFLENLSKVFGIRSFDTRIKSLKDNCKRIIEDSNNLIFQFENYSNVMFSDSIWLLSTSVLTIENCQLLERFFFSFCFVKGITEINLLSKILREFESSNELPVFAEFNRLISMEFFLWRVKTNFISMLKSPLFLNKVFLVFDKKHLIISNELYDIIECDDADSLQSRLNVSWFDVNMTIHEVYLIEYAAFLSATMCLKLLINSHCKITDRLTHFAIAGGNAEIIHICEQKNLSFKGTLKIAAAFHHNSVFWWLLETNKDVITEDVLKNCILYSNFTIFSQILTETKVNVNDVLLWACEYCHESLLIFIASIPGIDIDHKNANGQSPLHLACSNGDFVLLSYLLKCNLAKFIDFNSKMDGNDIAPLHLACQFNHPDIVNELLLVPKIDVNPCTFLKTRVTPLHLACKFGHLEIVKILINDKRTRIDALTYNVSFKFF